MLIRGRSCIAAIMACIILLCIAAPAYPSYNSEAAHEFSVASQRLANLRKSNKNQRYRSYWIDCIRTFELVERQYPKSSYAADACFERAGLYFELYQISRYSRDVDKSIQTYDRCQSAHPKHAKAAEALYRAMELSLDYKKSKTAAMKHFAKLSKTYPNSEWTTRAKARIALPAQNSRSETKIKHSSAPLLKSRSALPVGVVKGIRFWSGVSYTRVVIDEDTPPKFVPLELKKPARLVFDIKNAQLDSSVERDPLPVNDGILKQVRASQYQPDVVRVVLDLASLKSYAAFPLRDPNRLVIDVSGEDAKGTTLPTTASNPEPPANRPDGDTLSLSRQMALKVKTIAIDAGHGGHDPGAIGRGGLKEKDVTLDIARRLAALVKERLGCKVVMTRDKDVFIPLDERPAIARTKDADLFVSIHVNANRRRGARGIETYIQGLRASDRDAMATAARENATTSKTLSELDDELSRILKGLTMESKDEDSIKLADYVQGSLVDAVRPIKGRAVNLGVKRALFYVLMNTGMPSILAEIGFISNPSEERMLRKSSYRQTIAEALFQGVKKYVDSRGPKMAGL